MDNLEFHTLIDRIVDGGDDNWDYFDQHIGEHLQNRRCFGWARKTLLEGHHNNNVRDAAATILARGDFGLDDMEQAKLIGKARTDNNPFVRYWLASGLYKRGNRHPDVVAMWQEACQKDNVPAGEFARGLATN